MTIEEKFDMYIQHAEERMKQFMYDPKHEDEYFRWSRTRTTLINRLKEVRNNEWT